jgi:hypothetical protein
MFQAEAFIERAGSSNPSDHAIDPSSFAKLCSAKPTARLRQRRMTTILAYCFGGKVRKPLICVN